jgi:hypothetical protein
MGGFLTSFLVVYYVSLGWETDMLMKVDVLAWECWEIQLKLIVVALMETLGTMWWSAYRYAKAYAEFFYWNKFYGTCIWFYMTTDLKCECGDVCHV